MPCEVYKVTKLFALLFFLVSLNLTSSEQNGKRTVADPVSSFFSDLGDLFLDVDRQLHVQTAPKVQQQDRLVTQLFRPTNEYFNRIQNNYKSMQNRLGKIIERSLQPRSEDSDVSTLSPPRVGVKESGPSARSLASSQQVDASVQSDQEVSTDQETSFSKGSDTQEDECSGKPLENPFLEDTRKRKCVQKSRFDTEEQIRKALEKIMLDTRKASEILLPLGSNAINQLSNDLLKRQGDMELEAANPETRNVGDSLSQYDRSLRQFLRDHGRWLINNPLLSSFRQSPKTDAESLTDATEYPTEAPDVTTVDGIPEELTESTATETNPPSTTTEYRVLLSKSGKSLEDGPLPPQSTNYYTVVGNDGELIGEAVDVVLEHHSDYEDDDVMDIEPEERDTVILAFTSDGIPLKLRLGSEIDNPIRFLHKALKSAGVSLNIPVESYEDLEPVGREVLKLGSGILTRAVYIDASNPNELKSLLKTLRKSKGTGKAKY